MTRRDRWVLLACLMAMGAGWGITQPFAKIAVSEGYRHFGLIFWQLVIGAVVLGAITLWRRGRIRVDLPALRVYAVIALVGTILPNSASFQAAVHLPSGILSIALSIIPMVAFPIALGLGLDSFSWRRMSGLVLGLIAVLLLIVPEASLPEASMGWWVPVALIAPVFYAFEGNYVARWGTAGLGPFETLAGASILGSILALPLAVGSGQFIDPRGPWGAPDAALVASSLVHAAVYATYVWMVGRAGPTFAAQVSYLVTIFGVCWAMLILGERYAPAIWASLGLMLCGMALVQPLPGRQAMNLLGKARPSGDTDTPSEQRP